MDKMIIFGDIKEENGKTIRENNLEIKHNIPIGTLVEINAEECGEHGCRLFVVRHSRDCDGSILYSLCPDKTKIDENNMYHKYSWIGGWDEDSLIVIKGE